MTRISQLKKSESAKFVEDIDWEIQSSEDGQSICELVPSDHYLWYCCLKSASKGAVEKFCNSSLKELHRKFDEWLKIAKTEKPTKEQLDRKIDLEDYAHALLLSNEEDINCRNLWETQEDINELEICLKSIIGRIDEQGKKKLNPEFFLSAETGALVILLNLKKKQSKDVSNTLRESELQCLDSIKDLVQNEGKYNCQDIDNKNWAYWGMTKAIWKKVLESIDLNSPEIKKIHLEIFRLAIAIEEETKSKPLEKSIYQKNDFWGNPYENPHTITSAYAVVSGYLKTMTREEAIVWCASKDFDLNSINKRHYHFMIG